MKTTRTVLVAAILAISSSGAFAHDLDGNPDLRQSILNQHGKASATAKLERGRGDLYGSVLLDLWAGDTLPSAGPEKGDGDTYGSILYDL